MGPNAKSEEEPGDEVNMFNRTAAPSLPKHSYWFDCWAFVLFDIAFFLVMYFIVP